MNIVRSSPRHRCEGGTHIASRAPESLRSLSPSPAAACRRSYEIRLLRGNQRSRWTELRVLVQPQQSFYVVPLKPRRPVVPAFIYQICAMVSTEDRRRAAEDLWLAEQAATQAETYGQLTNVPRKPTRIRGDNAAIAHTTRGWTFEVVDLDRVPMKPITARAGFRFVLRGLLMAPPLFITLVDGSR